MVSYTPRFLQDEYNLRTFNTDFGREITESRDPDVEYSLSDLKIRVYESPEYSFIDLIHPFRPSGDIIVELDNPDLARGYEMFLDGDIESLEELDKELMSQIESERSADFYKQIL